MLGRNTGTDIIKIDENPSEGRSFERGKEERVREWVEEMEGRGGAGMRDRVEEIIEVMDGEGVISTETIMRLSSLISQQPDFIQEGLDEQLKARLMSRVVREYRLNREHQSHH